ncbi:LacI family DNA-binding transcriptional regulator [Limosilactobacillus caccae]|uniref:LacI family DNA-binding transcriptional regulator n=1 Tax=Limosilactobacillus caccae TaxID=1926284 RepID=UPI000970CA57|nr:LacI family DNA-binding transcriptional regulator [Limosilactobacillus caccae]
MEEEKVTIKTIAKIANVSHTTVSRALNDSPLVKEETKKKIRELAAKMNYTPNLNAKALVEQKSFIIVVYFTDMADGTSPSFMSAVIHQIKDQLPKGYEIAVDSFASLRRAKQSINLRFDGALVVSQSASDDEYIEQLAETGKPVVVLNRKIDRDDLYNYSSDDYAGTTSALNYLLRMGHRDIAMIAGRKDFASAKLRCQAFYDVLKANDIAVRQDWMLQGNYSIDSGYKAMEDILNAGDLPSCVFAANDDMAMGAIRACEDYGFKVPEDISFIGFDDNAYSQYYNPRITTIKKPTSEITHYGIGVLKALIDNKQPELPRFENLKPALVVRDSVKKLK